MRVELIPNIPCPHCEKQNTTHRLVRKEDGFTKVSRRCTSCSNEWTHTWDRDWLADAKIKRLSAENIELRARVERLQQEDTKTRHALKGWVWVCPDGGDEPTHERVAAIVSEVERLRAERDALRYAAREYLETLGGAMKSGRFEMSGSAEMAHFVRQAMQRLDSLVFDRAGPRPAGLEKLHEPHGRAS